MTIDKVPLPTGELAYEVRGSGTPVVLLHGGALDRATWDAEFDLLAAARTAIRYDARGHGASSSPSGPFAHHDDLHALLHHLGLPSATLVGLSLGARTSVDFALTHPDLVDALVLVAPGVSGMAFADPFILGQLQAVGRSGGDAATITECFLRMWVDGPHRSPADVAPDVRALCGSIIGGNLARHTPGGQRFATEVGAVDRLGELTAPTLLVVGDQDSADIRGVVDRIDGAGSDTRVAVVPGAGHMVNLEQPAAFRGLLLDFLGRLPQPAAREHTEPHG